MSGTVRKSIFFGTFVSSQSLDTLSYQRDVAVCVDEKGVIKAFDKECRQGVTVTETLLNKLGWKECDVTIWRSQKGQFYFPGFIASQYPNVGVFGKTTLMDWLNNYTFPIESSMKDSIKWNNNCRLFCNNTIDTGNSLITPIITPRFAPSCTSQMMYKLGALHRETGLPIQTHISENRNEIDIVHKIFPQCTSYANVYDQHGLLGKKTILAHAVHLTEEEVNLIKLRQSKISHCPISNTALTSGEAKIRWLLKKGIDVGLGSDVSGGYSTSILETAKHAILVSRHLAMNGDEEAKLSVEEALYLATRGGAKVIGLEQKLGAFDVGMMWDVQLIGLNSFLDDFDGGNSNSDSDSDSSNSNNRRPFRNDGKVDIFSWEVEEKSLVEKWIFNGDDRNTLAVWVQGRLVHHRGVN
ncbi:hypothetical protein EPUL_003216 [Erysiphe pulchra]|uniref:Amidohydrolase-related domain-containing protein n=1 Tax=Erysiphe pulchra TaxID=225359 RepID=A0A2S4PU48_9PEZI|nr:hypothetical protein EPUL_003216 [Erysiphe pulchra]